MESINKFVNTKISRKGLSSILGGIKVPTSMWGEETSDTWDDENNDGKINSGDTITRHDCPEIDAL